MTSISLGDTDTWQQPHGNAYTHLPRLVFVPPPYLFLPHLIGPAYTLGPVPLLIHLPLFNDP